MKKIYVHYPYSNYVKVYEDGNGVVLFGSDTCRDFGNPRWSSGEIIFTDHTNIRYKPPPNKLLVLEPPRVCPLSHEDEYLKTFERVYTFGNSELENVRHYRYGIPPLWPEVTEIITRPWNERINKVCCITGNKYPERVAFLHAYANFFKTLGLDLDVWGVPGFEGLPWYRGEVPGGPKEKREWLSKYRYCLALENTCMKRYLSEKLLDGLASGCICFYYGGADKDFYPEVPWHWVSNSMQLGFTVFSHQRYLSSLEKALPDLKQLNFTSVWRQILTDFSTEEGK